MFRINLPIPPSVNAAFGSNKRKTKGKGRYKNPRYKQWIDLAHGYFNTVKPLPYYTRPVVAKYKFYFPDNRIRDIGNYEKATSDILVSAGVLKDDVLIDELHLYRMDKSKENPRVEIEITEL